MKKYLILLSCLLTAAAVASACDICGCGTGNNYIGILPEFHKHIVGLRYRYNALLTHVGVGGQPTYLTTRERYTTMEAWGGWNITPKLRLMVSVPYSFNEKEKMGSHHRKNGLGDVSLTGYYQVLNQRRSVGSNLLVQSLWIGGGVKLATGRYNPADKADVNNNANLFQLGTGSTDINLGLMYDVRLQDAGINLSSNYKINTANRYRYQYGNKLSFNSQAYYKFRVKKKLTVAPNLGVQYETSTNDRDGFFPVAASGGRLLLGTAGIETTFSRFAVGVNGQTPLSQSLAKGIVKANNRLMVHLAVTL